MPLGKRELARIEGRLITALTEACETAKGEIKGFSWLTHTADLNALAETLKVIWVFETLADRKLALVDAKVRIFETKAMTRAKKPNITGNEPRQKMMRWRRWRVFILSPRLNWISGVKRDCLAG
ncbi:MULTISPECIES: hypothetical protein [unclassified Pseudomonas]|uniref:hypothetical protein n=1 Tax=unclassified Pseudomonas TaxID=196821 RepID=UPI000357A0D3|nr:MULTISPECIES: hypothetical protein [unclassified Pseudomonas]EPJ76127.1 hypothetical protein CFT9_27326 [Pseudomonas sp. CFT9]